MSRLPGNPGLWRRALYAMGFRLPVDNRDWVKHDLTDAGWRVRILARHLGLMVPICVLLALLPGEWWLRLMVALLFVVASTFTVVISADDLRNARLRQHGLPPVRRSRG